ncbi:MAG: hypothetical protein ABFS46_07865 [Myxococcota bacterium]
MSDRPEIVFCYYRVRPGQEEALVRLQHEHIETLRKLDLITEEPATLYRGADERGLPFLVKFFTWRSPQALDAAHQHPEVQRHWEAMEPLCEDRDGRPGMEFPHVERTVI